MKRLIVILAIAAGVGLAIYYFTRPTAHTLVLTGTVDGNEIVVGSQITGRLVKMNVLDGQAVKAGDVIAVLDNGVQTADAEAAAAAIAQADSNAAQSADQTALLQNTLAAKVQQTEAQRSQAQAQLSQAEAQAAQAQANWDKANANYVRTVPLARKGVASPLDLDNAKADVDAAAAARRAAQDGVTAAQRNLAAADATVQDAREQQRQVQVQQQQTRAYQAAAQQAAANHRAQLAQLGFTEITAPISGVITLRAARDGEVVSPDSPVVTIFDLGDTWVDADVEETYAPLIQLGQILKVRLANGEEISGPVIYKAVEADFATQHDVSRTKRDIKTVAIRVRVNNPRGELALGMTAYVLLPVPANLADAPPVAAGLQP